MDISIKNTYVKEDENFKLLLWITRIYIRREGIKN